MESIDFCNRQFLEHLGGGHHYHHTSSTSSYNHNYGYHHHQQQNHHLPHEHEKELGRRSEEQIERIATTRTQVEQVQHSFESNLNSTPAHLLSSHFTSPSSPPVNNSLHQLTNSSFNNSPSNPFHSPNSSSILSSPISNISSSPSFNPYQQNHNLLLPHHSTPESRSDRSLPERVNSSKSSSSLLHSPRSTSSISSSYLYESFLGSVPGSKFLLPGLNISSSNKPDQLEEGTLSFPPSPSDSTGNGTCSTEDENSSRSGFEDGSVCESDNMRLLFNRENHGIMRGHRQLEREQRRRRRHGQPPVIQRHAANMRERRRMQSINEAFEVRNYLLLWEGNMNSLLRDSENIFLPFRTRRRCQKWKRFASQLVISISWLISSPREGIQMMPSWRRKNPGKKS